VGAPSPPEPGSPETSPGSDQAFDWTLFFKFIGPDWFMLLIAVGVGNWSMLCWVSGSTT